MCTLYGSEELFQTFYNEVSQKFEHPSVPLRKIDPLKYDFYIINKFMVIMMLAHKWLYHKLHVIDLKMEIKNEQKIKLVTVSARLNKFELTTFLSEMFMEICD